MKSKKVFHIIGRVIAGIIFAVCIGFALGWIIMSLWNWLLPAILGIAKISYLQAVGIFVLARILFGSFHHSFGRREHGHGSHMCGGEHAGWKKWKLYDEDWKSEGKERFETVVKNCEKVMRESHPE